jgi:hypothetical protein
VIPSAPRPRQLREILLDPMGRLRNLGKNTGHNPQRTPSRSQGFQPVVHRLGGLSAAPRQANQTQRNTIRAGEHDMDGYTQRRRNDCKYE